MNRLSLATARSARPVPVRFVRGMDHYGWRAFQINDSGTQERDGITQLPDTNVALGTQQPTDQPGVMAVIDVDLHIVPEWITTDSTPILLVGTERRHVLTGETVDAFEGVSPAMARMGIPEVLHRAGRRAVLSVGIFPADVLVAPEAVPNLPLNFTGPFESSVFVLAVPAPPALSFELGRAKVLPFTFPFASGATVSIHAKTITKE